MRGELQHRTLAGFARFPELMDATPQFITGDEPWHTIRRGLEAWHRGECSRLELMRGMWGKYGAWQFWSLLGVLEDAETVPGKRWAETQIQRLMEAIEREYEGRNAQ
ncbi:protein of unknown function [Pseudodesulfovibrio profundus]|uniref:Uncharacterized protein n=1 Tax=Pseudodesulfovibrio profundus TaxID=57320 RepID=A0A2C8FDN8_9BACT|nr:hypothetical protein [Pseudodesulfovibrio profundus]SOB60617.1 protein of unknown function [Pseudodesulfovibrio profundus]